MYSEYLLLMSTTSSANNKHGIIVQSESVLKYSGSASKI